MQSGEPDQSGQPDRSPFAHKSRKAFDPNSSSWAKVEHGIEVKGEAIF